MNEEDVIREAFKVLDYENKGYITAKDLKHFMTTVGDKLSEEEVNTMIAEADTKGDGKIDYEQYLKIMVST